MRNLFKETDQSIQESFYVKKARKFLHRLLIVLSDKGLLRNNMNIYYV